MAKKRKEKNVPNIGVIVLSALKKLMKNTGWTTRSIAKFIKTDYSLIDTNLGRKVSRALKRGVRLGLVQLERGRYRLNTMSGLAHRVSSAELRARARRQARARAPKPPKHHQLRMRSRSPSMLHCCCSGRCS